MKILITGSAGFIGFHLSTFLLKKGFQVFGIDNLNSYYPEKIKKLRLERLKEKGVATIVDDINNLNDLYHKQSFDILVNLAARPGARAKPHEYDEYLNSNILGFKNLLDFCVDRNIKKIIYASSSSVYSSINQVPFKEDQMINQPDSIYAASKIFNENIAGVYHSNFGIDFVGLRFFTVYGEWGRPDMSYYYFLKNILDDEEITLFNNGQTQRDFTHISDITSGCYSAIDYLSNNQCNEIFNLGNDNPIKIIEMVNFYENQLNKKAKIRNIKYRELEKTQACLKKSKKKLNYQIGL